MKLAKSLLLGSAAGLAAVAGAQAADLPVTKAAPVEYVRVCSTYGAGFFYVPGTDSCLRLSGRVRVDVRANETFTRAQDAFGVRVRGRIQADHRTATAYGLLRTVVRFEITRDSGSPFGLTGSIGSNPQVAQAFIQFGGLTAGRVTSFFDNPDLPTTHMGTLRFSDAPDVNLIAYTFSFGNGFSATLSLEDPQERRVTNLFDFYPGGVPLFPGAPLAFQYGGARIPDVVGNVRYTGTWGGVQLSGAVHQVREIGGLVNPFTGVGLRTDDSDYGFAVALEGYVNIPFLGAGDSAWLAATYTDGAVGYILGGRGSGLGLTNTGLSLPLVDAYINPFTGNTETTTAWSIAGGVTHNWTPQFSSSLFGSYARFEFDGAAAGVTAGGASIGLVDFDEWRIGANTFWKPISGLQLGVEVIYANIDPKGRVAFTNVGNGRLRSSEDAWEGRLRIQRDF